MRFRSIPEYKREDQSAEDGVYQGVEVDGEWFLISCEDYTNAIEKGRTFESPGRGLIILPVKVSKLVRYHPKTENAIVVDITDQERIKRVMIAFEDRFLKTPVLEDRVS